MDKVINSYEALFIVNCENGEEAVKATVNKFTGLVAETGTVESVNEWGKRRLAYPIDDIPEGYYVVVNFKSESDFPAELERIFNIDESIMRSIVVKIDPKKVAAKEEAQPEATAETTADAE